MGPGYCGDYWVGQVVDCPFDTPVLTLGIPILTTLAGSPACKVFQANSSTSTAGGVTLSLDLGYTGQHHVRISTGSDTTFYVPGKDYRVVLTAGTLGGSGLAGTVVGSFSIQNRSTNTAGAPSDYSTCRFQMPPRAQMWTIGNLNG